MIRFGAALLAVLWAGVACADGFAPPPSLSAAQAAAAAPVQSVTGQTGNVILPTPCGNTSIPAGNTITSTATETAFASTCVIPANSISPGTVLYLHVGGVYNSGTGQTATGRIHYTNAGTPAPASDTTIVNTGALSGVAASSPTAQWWGDVFITCQTTTTMDVQAKLFFQATAANVDVPLANTSTFAIDPTRPLTFYLTVQWGSTSSSNSMTLRTMVAK